MTDHPRLTRYIVYANGTTFMGMLKQNNTHPELFGPDFDWTHGPYVLASEADAEIDRLRAEVERLQSRLGKIYWATTTNPDGLGLGDIQNICRPFSETHDPYADQNRALVAEIAARRGITLGHLREDGGCELAQIMRRLDAADAEVERLRSAPHCPTCECERGPT